MGYTGDYSLLARCASECFATMTFVFFVECLFANKLLPKTKAHDLTFGWLAFGVGIAVFIPVQFLGFISTYLNPAMVLGTAIAEQIDWYDFFVLSLSETIGAFIGAILMWLYYLPQFETNPAPAPDKKADRLLHTRDDMNAAALDFVSYNTRPEAVIPESGIGMLEFGRMMSATRRRPTSAGRQLYRVSELLGRDAFADNSRASRRRSVTVADIHRRIQELDHPALDCQRVHKAASDIAESPYATDDAAVIDVSINRDEDRSNIDSLGNVEANRAGLGAMRRSFNDSAVAVNRYDMRRLNRPQPLDSALAKDEETDDNQKKKRDEVDAVVVASHIADQNMKLAVFCIRPARYLPISNLLTEIISTFYLVLGILFIKERAEFLYDGYDDVYKHGFIAFFVGLLIFLLVLCLGGMGVAMNPARDLAPRFAHWILPVDGKGFSEWYYAWITVVGPLIGGAVGGGVFRLMILLNKGEKEGMDFDDQDSSLSRAISGLTENVSAWFISSSNSSSPSP